MNRTAPRRVLMTLDAVGGVWRYAMDLGRALAGRGTEVVFACLGPAPNALQRREAESCGELVVLDAPLDWLVEGAEELSSVPGKLAELAGRHAVDLLHCNVPSQAAGLSLDIPIVAAAHSCVVTWFRAVRGEDVPPGWAWQRQLNQAGLDAADIVLAPSSSFAELLVGSYGEMHHLRVVYNAVPSPAATMAKEPFVLSAGRWWDEGKNGATLDTAAAISSWPVLMAGSVASPGGQRIHLREARWLGELPHPELCKLLSRAAIFCSPSLYEPFGLAPLEAASAGAALVLADIPTYRELWEGAALFASPTVAAEFAACLNRLADDGRLRRQLGDEAARRAAKFTLSAQLEGVVAAYADAALLHSATLRRRA